MEEEAPEMGLYIYMYTYMYVKMLFDRNHERGFELGFAFLRWKDGWGIHAFIHSFNHV